MDNKKKRGGLARIFHGKKYRGYHPLENANIINDSKPPQGGSAFVPDIAEARPEYDHENDEPEKPS